MGQKIDVKTSLALIDRYVCARCYGHLVAVKAEGGLVELTCANSMRGLCNGTGFVTRHYAEQRRSESKAELWEVRKNYPQLEPRLEISTEQILKELCFAEKRQCLSWD